MYKMELTAEQTEMNDVPEFPAVPSSIYARQNCNRYRVYGKGFGFNREVIGEIVLATSLSHNGVTEYGMEYSHKVDGIKLVFTIEGHNYAMETCEDLIKKGALFEKI